MMHLALRDVDQTAKSCFNPELYSSMVFDIFVIYIVNTPTLVSANCLVITRLNSGDIVTRLSHTS